MKEKKPEQKPSTPAPSKKTDTSRILPKLPNNQPQIPLKRLFPK